MLLTNLTASIAINKMKISTNKKTFGWGCIALFLFLSCGRRDILTDAAFTTTTQQTPANPNQDRDKPLHQAILAQTDLGSLYTFLQATSINQPDKEGNTPLHLAVIQDNLPLVGLLLSEKAAIDAQNAAGLTPLHLAAKQGNLLTLHLLLIYQADIHAKDKAGHKPLNYIKEKQQTDELQQLLKRTPWDAIARERDPFVVAWLLAAEKTKTKDNQGWTPLHLAACLGQMEAIQNLVATKADIKAKNKHHWTPLHLAAFAGQIEAVQFLIDHQAPIWAVDYKGRTAYDIAESAAVKQLLGLHMNLSKLIFQCDYDNIGKQLLNYLTAKDKGKLRQTCTEMGCKLLQQGALRLQVTPDTLQHLHPYLHPRLYPHGLTPYCVCPTFDPIPVEVVVKEKKHVWDWINIAKDKRFLIKNVLYKGNIYQWDDLRVVVPEHLRDSISLSDELRGKYLGIKPTHKPVHLDDELVYSDNDQEYSDSWQVDSDNERIYSDNEQIDSDNEQVYSDRGEATTVDPGNRLYDSFIGIKKLPAGKVKIVDYLAEGSFGKVFCGQWGDKVVALKQIDLKHAATKLGVTCEEVEESMQWEIARLSTINHPNLVQFYGLYQDENEGYTYMVMEFCEGGMLQDKLEKADVPWSQRWQWALQISEALAYLHGEGALHRNLKAENILLDKQGRAKLADLGVAQVDALLQETEASVVAMGAQDKRFIVPEVEACQTLSTKETDIYALGLVFWQIATGQEPRKIDDLSLYRKENWQKGRERDAISADCPESFKQLMLECWAKDPNQRPTAQGVLAKLAALGPELDPHHNLLVTAAQKLEQLVHPKRKEGRAYIAPFVTPYSVDESIETYWNRIEAAKIEEEVNTNPPLTLAETFEEFIETPNANTLLLLGEAGLGKTLTTYQWGDQLLNQWWTHMNTGAPAPAYFPLFIRPEVTTWSHAGIKGAFQEVARKYNLPKGIQPLIFIDGYDELQLDAEPTNLVEHLGLSEIGHSKLIVTCRPQTVRKSELASRFGFKGALAIRYFLPFRLDQLLSYLQQERSGEEAVYQEYQKTLENTESVRTVLRNPFVLHLFRESWEALSQRPLRQLNRWQIYESFIAHRLAVQQPLLSEKVQKWLQGSHPDLLSSYQGFTSEIAWRAFQKKAITLGRKEARNISLWGHVKEYAQKEAKKEFTKRQMQLKAELEQAPEEKKAQLIRRSLLSEAAYVSLTQKRVAQFESTMPLKLRREGKKKQYEYSHKSLFEYGVAKRLLLLQHSPTIVGEGIGLLNRRKIQEEPEVLQFWQEGLKEPGSKALIEPFFKIITRSRQDETIQQASANAATLLAQAGVPFSGRDLQRVRLPGADLSGALLSYTNLAGAQLPGAHLKEAYLRNADFRGANLSSVDFGQYPSLKCKAVVHCLSYHPAGTQLAVGLDNGNIELYNKMEEVYTPIATLRGHTSTVNSVTYHPDGHQLASGSNDHTVGIWDLQGRQLIALLKGHNGWVRSVAYSPDGYQLASGSYDETVGLWDPRRRQLIWLLKGHTGRVNSVAYRPDGQQLASASEDNTVGLWDPHCQELISLLHGHSGRVLSVAYRPDGQQLASGSYDKTVGLWDPHRQELIALLQGHTDMVRSVTYRPDGQQLASGSLDNTVGLWDPHHRQLISQLKGHTNWVWSVTYRPDGQQLASGSYDNMVNLWDPHAKQPISLLQGHNGGVMGVTYHPDSQQLASGSEDRTVGLWDLRRQQLIALLQGHTGRVRSVTYRPDGQQLASGSEDNTIGLWNPHAHQLISLLQGHTDRVNSVTYRPDGQQLASGSFDNTIGLWDPHSQQLVSLFQGHTGRVNSVTYRPDGQQLASGSNDHTIGLWDPHSQQIITLLQGHTGMVLSVAYRPDGKQLASGGSDNMVGLWDPHRRKLISLLKGHTGMVWSVTYRPDGHQLASGSSDHTVGLWDPYRKKLIAQLQGHTGMVLSVTYRPDGQQLASASNDHAIFVWAKQDIAALRQETWQLIHRFENGARLLATGALLKGATISANNWALLKQKGANATEDPENNLQQAATVSDTILTLLEQVSAKDETGKSKQPKKEPLGEGKEDKEKNCSVM